MKTSFEQEDIQAIEEIIKRNLEIRFSTRSLEGVKDEILNKNELSKLLKIKPSKIYAMVNQSKYSDDGIPFLKVGNELRFSKKSVLKWAENNGNKK